MNTANIESHIQIVIENYVKDKDFTYKFSIKSNKQFQLDFEFIHTFDTKVFVLNFLKIEEIKNTFGVSLAQGSKTLTLNLKSYIFISNSLLRVIDILAYSIMGLISLLLIAILPLMYFKKYLDTFWQFIEYLQIIHLFLFINTGYPIQCIKVLRAVGISNFYIYQNSNLLKEPDNNINLSNRFQEEYLNGDFITNSGFPSLIFILLITFMLTIRLIMRLNRGNEGSDCILKVKAFQNYIEYSLFFRIIILLYVSILIGVFSQFRVPMFQDVYNIFSFIFAIIGFIVLFGFYLISWYLLNYNEKIRSNDDFIWKFYPIIGTLKKKAFFKRNFINLNIFRKIIWVFAVTIIEEPHLQLGFMIFAQILIFTFFIMKMPYLDNGSNYLYLLIEMIITIIIFLIGWFMSFQKFRS